MLCCSHSLCRAAASSLLHLGVCQDVCDTLGCEGTGMCQLILPKVAAASLSLSLCTIRIMPELQKDL